MLLNSFDGEIVFLNSETMLVSEYYANLSFDNHISCQLADLPSVLNSFDVCISSDSFVAHLSNFLNLDVIQVFKDNNFREWCVPNNFFYRDLN